MRLQGLDFIPEGSGKTRFQARNSLCCSDFGKMIEQSTILSTRRMEFATEKIIYFKNDFVLCYYYLKVSVSGM